MAAFGELLIYLIYGIFILSCIVFMSLAFFSKKKKRKLIFGISALIAGIIFFLFSYNQIRNKRENEMHNVGSYSLTNYPFCDSCKVVLKEDNTFEVTDRNKIFEKGDWTYESGGDYWIVYLNKKKDQLGSGIYQYNSFTLKQKEY